jgi:hypothetical protein
MYSSVDPFKSYQLQCRVRSYNGIYPLKPWLHSEVRSCAHQSTSYSIELNHTIEFTHRNQWQVACINLDTEAPEMSDVSVNAFMM